MSRGLPKIRAIASMAAATVFLLTGCSPEYVVFNPAGPVSKAELHLILLSGLLVLIVIVPVLALLGFIVYRYRDRPGNTTPYEPDFVDSKKLEILWWGVPVVIVAILGVVTARTTFALAKSPEPSAKPLTIQVVSLDWKWLFVYPDQKIATVNYCDIPTGVPVQFVLTADAPMNSFWVPQLGGQEYTMPGMAMRLWLQADRTGSFQGYGSNFSGVGFAHMTFKVNAQSASDFNAWVNHVKQSSPALTSEGYQQLAKPSLVGQSSYSSIPAGLFQQIIDEHSGMGDMSGMHMADEAAVNAAGPAQGHSDAAGQNSMGGMDMTSPQSSTSGNH